MNGLLPISLNASIQQQLNPNIVVVKELEKSKFLLSYLLQRYFYFLFSYWILALLRRSLK